MDAYEKETLDFDLDYDKEFGYIVRLRGSIFEGIEFRYTMLKIEGKGLNDNLYFDYEITKNPNSVPLTDELHNFISFVTDKMVRSGLVKEANETNRNSHTGKPALQ